jgi:hypothetical protein
VTSSRNPKAVLALNPNLDRLNAKRKKINKIVLLESLHPSLVKKEAQEDTVAPKVNVVQEDIVVPKVNVAQEDIVAKMEIVISNDVLIFAAILAK